MPELDVAQLIKMATQGGPPAIIIALFYGLAMLVREVRGGKVSESERAQLTKRITELEARQRENDGRLERIEQELDEALELLHGMRYQRDQARLRCEYLELVHGVQPRTTWPADPARPAPPAPPPATPPQESP